MGKPKDQRPRDHYVSAGWQKNFSQDGKVCHFSVLTGEIVDRDRNVERSLYQRDYGTYWEEDGTSNRSVDEMFSATEYKVIKPLRRFSTRMSARSRSNGLLICLQYITPVLRPCVGGCNRWSMASSPTQPTS